MKWKLPLIGAAGPCTDYIFVQCSRCQLVLA
jgi:hypothetical protein